MRHQNLPNLFPGLSQPDDVEHLVIVHDNVYILMPVSALLNCVTTVATALSLLLSRKRTLTVPICTSL